MICIFRVRLKELGDVQPVRGDHCVQLTQHTGHIAMVVDDSMVVRMRRGSCTCGTFTAPSVFPLFISFNSLIRLRLQCFPALRWSSLNVRVRITLGSPREDCEIHHPDLIGALMETHQRSTGEVSRTDGFSQGIDIDHTASGIVEKAPLRICPSSDARIIFRIRCCWNVEVTTSDLSATLQDYWFSVHSPSVRLPPRHGR